MRGTGEKRKDDRSGLTILEAGVIAAVATAEVAASGITAASGEKRAASGVGTKGHGKQGRTSGASSPASIGSWKAVARGSVTVAVQKPANVGGGIAAANGCCSWVIRTRKVVRQSVPL